MNFLFENNTETLQCIEVIKCPNLSDCENEIGDRRYDSFNVMPNDSHQINTKCDEICWRHCGGKFKRTSARIIAV